MPNVKKITVDFSQTGATIYTIIRREVDNYRLNDADGAFAAAPADPYISLTEDAVIKGRYELSESRTAWNDGKYTAAVYRQAGGSPAPVSDMIVSSWDCYIISDVQYELPSDIINTIVTKLPTNYIMGSSVQTAKDDEIDAILEDTGTTLDGKLDTLLSRISATVATALTKIADVAIAGTETAGSLLRLFYDRVTGAVALDSTVAKEATLNTKIPTALTFTGSDVKATLDGEKVILSDTTEGQIDTIETYVDEVESLMKGSGANQVTIQLYETGGTTPISDASITLLNSGETLTLGVYTSNTLGQAITALNNGTYKIRCKKATVVFTVPETLVVFGNTSKTIYGVAQTVPIPSASNVCRVYEWCFGADGNTPLTSVDAEAYIEALPYDYNGKLHIGTEITPVYSSVTGLLYWDIVYGAKVRFYIKDIQPVVRKTIPSSTTARLTSIS